MELLNAIPDLLTRILEKTDGQPHSADSAAPKSCRSAAVAAAAARPF
jgi:hypothetical protein